MEIKKVINHLKLPKEEKQYKYWSKNFDKILENLKVEPINDKMELDLNLNMIEEYKLKYPFYAKVLEFIKKETDLKILKPWFINKITYHLNLIFKHGNLIVSNGEYSYNQKRNYNSERLQILKDLRSMIFEAIYYNKALKFKNQLHNHNGEPQTTIILSGLPKQFYEIEKRLSSYKYDFSPKKIGFKIKQDEFSQSEPVNTFNFSKLKAVQKKEVDDLDLFIDNNFEKLLKALDEIEIYNSEKKYFHFSRYPGINNLKSFQYLVFFFITETLEMDIEVKIKTKIYRRFNREFNVRTSAGKKEMTSQNWKSFEIQLDEITNDPNSSDFYTDLSNQMKKTTLLQSK